MKVLLITDYADYSYIMAIVLWASVIMDGGINNLIFNKSLSNNFHDISSLFSAKLFLSTLVIIGLTLFFVYRKPDLAVSAILYSVIIYLSSSSAFIKMFSRGKGYNAVDLTVILSEPLLRLFMFSLTYLIIKGTGWELWVMMVVYLLAGLFAFIINFLALNKNVKIKIHIDSVKEIYNRIVNTFKISKYYLLYYLMYIGIGRVDVLFLEKYAIKTDLALFSSAITIYAVIQLFFFSLITSQFKNIYKNPKKIFTYIILFLIFIIVVTLFVSNFVFKNLFSSDYLGGASVLNSVIFAVIPSVLVYYFIAKLNYENKTLVNFIILIIPLVIKILIYSFAKSPELGFYQMNYTIIEYLILGCYIIYFIFYENTSRKQVFKT